MTASSTGLVQVQLKPRKAQPFFCRHPWVLDKAIAVVGGEPNNGDVVDLVSDQGRWIARGIFNAQSRIRVRLYTWDENQQLDEAFWRKKLTDAVALRVTAGYDSPDTAARLVYSEADGLSGLIVDRYGRHLVVQPTAQALATRLPELVPLLAELVQPESIAVRLDDSTAKKEGIELREELVWGSRDASHTTIDENGVKFRVELAGGQKTGFYLDQRENHRCAARYMRGRRVLDVCCYTGGFALSAAKLGGAAEVVGVDSSEAALQLARENASLNGLENVRFESGDCFDTLTARLAAGEKYGAIVLDPPKFAASRKNIDAALRAYHRLNLSAVQLLEPGGILVTCCCSGAVDRSEFAEMLFGVALKSGRSIQLLEQFGASPDHPVMLTCPESAYLKCFICRVI